MALLSAVHLGLPPPGCPHRQALVTGPYRHYHYGCDGVDDRGWGCGYRTLQMMCSWLAAAGGEAAAGRPVPSLKEIQDSLVEMGDKPPSFAGSRDWIGTVEAALCLDHFYHVPGRLLHVRLGRDLEGELETLYAHFQGGGGPVMMGGGQDHASKGLLGVCSGPEGHHLLTLDPHYYGPAGSLSRQEAQAKRWVSWRGLGSFEEASFYNLCLPQFRAKGAPHRKRGLPEARHATRTSSLSPFQGTGCGWASHAWHVLGASTWKEKPWRQLLHQPRGAPALGSPWVAEAPHPSSGATARPAALPDHCWGLAEPGLPSLACTPSQLR